MKLLSGLKMKGSSCESGQPCETCPDKLICKSWDEIFSEVNPENFCNICPDKKMCDKE